MGVAYLAIATFALPRADPPPPSGAGPDYVIALSSGVREDSSLSPDGARRLRAAIQFAKLSGAPTLVTTRVQRTNPVIASDVGQRRLVDSSGFTSRWQTLDGVALTTRDEAERFRRLVNPPARIAVVTSASHTRRACATFEKLGFEVTCVSSGRRETWWMWPYSVAYETLALIKYRAKGWI